MIKCGNERCSAVETCKFWNNEQCPFFEVAPKNPAKKKKPKKEKAPRPKEDSEQQAVIEFCELARIPIVHIPNEGKRTAAYAARLKAMGLRKGFPDLFIPRPLKGYCGLFIELKRDRYTHPTKEQMDWICYLNGAGYKALICYGAAAAIREIQTYFRDTGKR